MPNVPKLKAIYINKRNLFLISLVPLIILFGLSSIFFLFYYPKQVKGITQQTPTIITLNPSKDARIFQYSPNMKGGSHIYLNVGTDNGTYLEWSLLEFDLFSVPPGFDIDKAELQLYQYTAGNGANDGQLVGVRNITGTWEELGVTWNNKPAWGDTYDYRAITKANDWKTWDITNLVKDWFSGAKINYGLYLFTDDKSFLNSFRVFHSKESNSANYRPKLVLTDLPECDGGPSGEIFPSDAWYACYYQGQIDSTNFLGSAKTIISQPLNFNWGTGVIFEGKSDNVSASFRRLVDFTPGYYKFTIESDDAVSLSVGTYEIYKPQDLYQPTGYNSYTSEPIYLKGKKQIIVLWHEDTGNALLRLSWQNVAVQEKTIIGVDADISGNTATSLDSINSCISVTSGQTFDVDLFARDINILSAQGVSLDYDPSLVEVSKINSQMFLASKSGSSLLTDSTEINNTKGHSFVGAVDTNTVVNQSVESGSGVLARITLRALKPGVAILNITPTDVNKDSVVDYGSAFSNAGGYAIIDTNKDGIFDGQASNSIIAIGQPCVDDFDNDGFADDKELYIGTDPFDACSDNISDPAWPFDINNDTKVNVGDILKFSAEGVLLTKEGDPKFNRRYDLNADRKVNVGDILLYSAKSVLLTKCSNL